MLVHYAVYSTVLTYTEYYLYDIRLKCTLDNLLDHPTLYKPVVRNSSTIAVWSGHKSFLDVRITVYASVAEINTVFAVLLCTVHSVL